MGSRSGGTWQGCGSVRQQRTQHAQRTRHAEHCAGEEGCSHTHEIAHLVQPRQALRRAARQRGQATWLGRGRERPAAAAARAATQPAPRPGPTRPLPHRPPQAQGAGAGALAGQVPQEVGGRQVLCGGGGCCRACYAHASAPNEVYIPHCRQASSGQTRAGVRAGVVGRGRGLEPWVRLGCSRAGMRGPPPLHPSGAPDPPALSSPEAASTVKGVQASCCPRQTPCETLVTSTAGAASALRTGGRAGGRAGGMSRGCRAPGASDASKCSAGIR